MPKRIIRTLFPVAFSVFLLWYTLRNIDLVNVRQRLTAIDPALVVLVIAIEMCIIVILSLRWQRILKYTGCTIPVSEAVMVYCGASPAEVILPMKTSDLLKANYLRVTRSFPFVKGVSSVFLDNVFDLGALVTVSCLGLALSGHVLSTQFTWVLVAVCAFILAAAAASRLVDHPVFASFHALGLQNVLELYALALAVWVSVCVMNTLYFSMAGMQVPFTTVMLYLPLTIMLAAVPVTVGGLGSVEWCMLTFYEGLGSPEAIITADLLQRIFASGFPMLIGLPFIARVMWPEESEGEGDAAPEQEGDEDEKEGEDE
ncbi:MAG: lysylphosphatidylglycerol synthase transmembrane domain-containing protein [Methanopyri archaeon]|nr:lysylphosphatidylglycerol synthase transmembrane domain-containing protein [Methanopyri archaeon]